MDVSAQVFRLKLDKFILLTIAVAMQWLLNAILKEMGKTKSHARVKKLGLKARKIDKFQFLITMITGLDIFFYSFHQLLHQKRSSLSGFNLNSISYAWSLLSILALGYLMFSVI
jgi:hypothetical protein